jgi:hypothetical protein
MKELSFEQMEKVQGGYHYCALICHWRHGGGGYQGSWEDLQLAWANNCTAYCS